MARRDATDPREQGIAPNWAWRLAGQPAHHVQPRQRRSRRQTLESAKPIIEWDGERWIGIDVPDYAPTTKPSDGVGPVHHESRRAWDACSLATRWSKARSPKHYEPFESPYRTSCIRRCSRIPQRGCLPTTGRRSATAAEFPVCRDHLSADRAFPLLDQARADQRDPAARGVRRDRRGLGRGEGHRAGRLGTRRPQSAASSCARPMSPSASGLCMVDGEPAHVIGVPIALGVHRPGAQGIRRQHADAVRRRRQYARRPSSRRSWSMSRRTECRLAVKEAADG